MARGQLLARSCKMYKAEVAQTRQLVYVKRNTGGGGGFRETIAAAEKQ
jgi:hypothetical protein